MRIHATATLRYLVPICILLGLTLSLAYHTAFLAPLHSDNTRTFHALSAGIDQYRTFKVAWRPRILSTFLAARASELGDAVAHRKNSDATEGLKYTVAFWSAFWFVLTGVLYILLAHDGSVFCLVGLFSAIEFGYMPQLLRVYPWDMPIIFIFTAFVLLLSKKRYWWLLILLPVGMGFKETTIVLCLVFLFIDLPKKRRALMCALSLTSCIIAKLVIDVYVRVPLPFFTMEVSRETDKALNVSDNLQYLLHGGFFPLSCLLVNSGTLLAFFLLPSMNRTVHTLKIIAATFVLIILCFGRINEYRIFFELIPFALYSLSLFPKVPGVFNNVEGVPHPVSWTVDSANHAASWSSSRCATAGVR